jgi:diguanylate cyclase
MHSNFSKAEKILEEIRKTVERETFYLPSAAKINLTVSIGFAEFCAGAPLLEEELIKLADSALYEAKNSGRNTVSGSKLKTADSKNDKKN